MPSLNWSSALGTRLAAPAALLAALVSANPGYAQPFQSGGGGVFIGYGGKSLIWGLEAFATRSSSDFECDSRSRWSVGPAVRWTLHGWSRPSLTFSAFGGRDIVRPVFAPIAELGLTVGFPNGIDSSAVFSPHTGLLVEMSVLQMFTHQEWLLQEYQVGGGVRFLPAMGAPGLCVAGRPQRNAAGERMVAAPARLRHEAQAGAVTTSRKVAEFRKAAAEEYASVAAFLQLARELANQSAPPSLVRRAMVAAEDELRHTVLCASALTHLTGCPFELDVPVAETRAALRGKSGMLRLAAESWFDGCLGEGLAAAFATHEAQTETDPALREVHSIIAKDERRHAELAWDILKFCLEREPQVRSLLLSLEKSGGEPETPSHAPLAQTTRAAARQRLHALCG